MKTRIIKKHEIEEVREKLKEFNLDFADDTLLIVNENEDGKISGVVGIRTVNFIEPLYSDNPIGAVSLYAVAEKILRSLNAPIVRCFSDHDKIETFNKAGFHPVFENKIALEKVLEE